MMDFSTIFVFIASRGLGKTFLCAVYCVCRAVLYPGTKIAIASGTRSQSINVLEKIMNELMPNSPELKMEIDERNSKTTGMDAKVVFKNGSIIKVVTASDNSRGNRAHILLLDEYRMIKKDVIDTILRKESLRTDETHTDALTQIDTILRKEYASVSAVALR